MTLRRERACTLLQQGRETREARQLEPENILDCKPLVPPFLHRFAGSDISYAQRIGPIGISQIQSMYAPRAASI
jgi:hypothetical protein